MKPTHFKHRFKEFGGVRESMFNSSGMKKANQIESELEHDLKLGMGCVINDSLPGTLELFSFLRSKTNE